MTWCKTLLQILSRDLLKVICPKWPGMEETLVHQDNAPSHKSKITHCKKNTEKSGFSLLDDSTYYPDLAPCGLFPVLKTQKASASFWKSHRDENEVHQQFRKMAKDRLWARSRLVSKVSNLAQWSISMISVLNFGLWHGAFSCKKCMKWSYLGIWM